MFCLKHVNKCLEVEQILTLVLVFVPLCRYCMKDVRCDVFRVK